MIVLFVIDVFGAFECCLRLRLSCCFVLFTSLSLILISVLVLVVCVGVCVGVGFIMFVFVVACRFVLFCVGVLCWVCGCVFLFV